MNGPEAARVMRDELHYRGLILGALNVISLSAYGHSVGRKRVLQYESIAGITGNVLAEDIKHFVSNGANEVIPKPLTKAKLLSVLQHYASM